MFGLLVTLISVILPSFNRIANLVYSILLMLLFKRNFFLLKLCSTFQSPIQSYHWCLFFFWSKMTHFRSDEMGRAQLKCRNVTLLTVTGTLLLSLSANSVWNEEKKKKCSLFCLRHYQHDWFSTRDLSWCRGSSDAQLFLPSTDARELCAVPGQ